MRRGSLRNEIITAARSFSSSGLSTGTSGNLSARTSTGYLITPSGIPYNEITESELVEMDMQGNCMDDGMSPSSEWRIHLEIYRSRPDTMAVVHVHSPYATAVACTRRDIPAFHYEIARTGGDSIRCADYATFGTQELADNLINAIEGCNACLLANHGQVVTGNSLAEAMQLAETVEVLAKQYTLSTLLGGPVLLDDNEMIINLERFSTYGKKGG